MGTFTPQELTLDKPHKDTKGHFFIASIFHHKCDRDAHALIEEFRHLGDPFTLWYVPTNINEDYDIRFYAPQVEGAEAVATYGYDTQAEQGIRYANKAEYEINPISPDEWQMFEYGDYETLAKQATLYLERSLNSCKTPHDVLAKWYKLCQADDDLMATGITDTEPRNKAQEVIEEMMGLPNSFCW